MDGLTGLSEAIEKVFPQATTQRCIVHIVRNIYSILDKKKAKEIISVEAFYIFELRIQKKRSQKELVIGAMFKIKLQNYMEIEF